MSSLLSEQDAKRANLISRGIVIIIDKIKHVTGERAKNSKTNTKPLPCIMMVELLFREKKKKTRKNNIPVYYTT